MATDEILAVSAVSALLDGLEWVAAVEADALYMHAHVRDTRRVYNFYDVKGLTTNSTGGKQALEQGVKIETQKNSVIQPSQHSNTSLRVPLVPRLIPAFQCRKLESGSYVHN